MFEVILGAILIMVLRIADVTLGTFRTIMVVQAKKYHSAVIGFFEVLIWIFAMRYIMQHMDQTINLFGYALGFGLGNLLGISLEQKIGIGYVQVNVISNFYTDKIADKLRESKFGVTILPAEGGSGGVSLLIIIIRRKDLQGVINLIEQIDKDSFITVQHSRPYRGFIHGARK
ncbi:MAG: hypothetical protein A2068_00990 [Ignavibacteria bacterium GWB2_35_6b]|nr:MAG: hypothetical protein A2068_00990 [Ignavibacteria bacterium GWB2_35_6b]